MIGFQTQVSEQQADDAADAEVELGDHRKRQVHADKPSGSRALQANKSKCSTGTQQ